MNEHIISYKPGPVATLMHQDTKSRAKLLLGPFGTGKSTSGAWDIIDFMSDRVMPVNGIKKSRFAVIRNTFPQLQQTTIKTYLDWFPPMIFGKYNAVKHEYVITFDNKEIEIIFKALDSPQDVRDLLSLEITGAHVDEARELHEDVFDGVLGRMGRYPSLRGLSAQNKAMMFSSPPQIILTTNYSSTEHWLYRRFVENRIDGYALYRQTQDENRSNLRPGYYEDLAKDYASRPDLLRTLVYGEWGITVKGKEVYPEFRRELHVSNEKLKPDNSMVLRGWDNTGLHPACIVTQLSPTGQWRILKEFVGNDIGITDFGEMVLMWCNQTFGANAKYRDVADPAGRARDTSKMSPALYLKKMGIELENGIQTFKVRREAVAGRLSKLINGEPALIIDPSCTRLINGFDGGYAYPEIGNSGVYRNEPRKDGFSDIQDSAQYLASRIFITHKSDPKRAIEALSHHGGGGGTSWMGT